MREGASGDMAIWVYGILAVSPPHLLVNYWPICPCLHSDAVVGY